MATKKEVEETQVKRDRISLGVQDIVYYVKDGFLDPFKNAVGPAVLRQFWGSTQMVGVRSSCVKATVMWLARLDGLVAAAVQCLTERRTNGNFVKCILQTCMKDLRESSRTVHKQHLGIHCILCC